MASGEQLATDPAELGQADIRRMGLSLQRSAVWLSGLIENALCAASLPAGRLVLQLQPSSLLDVVYEARLLLAPLLARNERKLRVLPRQAIPMLMIDRRRIGQVLLNLVANADKFSPSGLPIDVSLSSHKGWVRVSVADRGPGFPEQESERLFEPYYRATSVAEGSGLGLAIVKALVEAHSGRVGAENRSGGGARFWFELPAPLLISSPVDQTSERGADR
jgi:two-component system sensor histidine kinase KdpD